MARQKLNQGTYPTGAGGDNWRTGSAKLDDGIGELYSQFGANNQGVLPSALPVNKGGTGATTAANARTNLDVFSKTEVAQAIEAAKPSVIPDASTTAKGVVQLNNTLISTSVTLALTAAMGKKLQDEKLGKAENAVSASKLEITRTVQFSGAATGSLETDFSANASCVLTLTNSGVVAGTYGNNAAVPVVTVDAKGLLKVVATQAIRTATTAQTGIVQLADALNDASTTKALTAAMGKKLNDDKLSKAENAVSASKLEITRTVQFSGAATGSFNYDGSANSSCILTLADSGVVAGTYGNSATVPVITVDDKGLLKVVSTQAIRTATTAQTGVVRLNNTLTSTSIDQALTAAIGKKLNDDKLGKTETAASAKKLETARKINGVDFDGSKDVNISAPLPTASTTVKGGVKVGVGLSIAAESLSVQFATQAEANAGTNDTKAITSKEMNEAVKNQLNATGEAPMFVCRAWVNFSGDGVVKIQAEGNVLSVVRRYVGNYLVTLKKPLSTKDCAALVTASNGTNAAEYFVSIGVGGTDLVEIYIKDRMGNATSPPFVSLGVFC